MNCFSKLCFKNHDKSLRFHEVMLLDLIMQYVLLLYLRRKMYFHIRMLVKTSNTMLSSFHLLYIKMLTIYISE